MHIPWLGRMLPGWSIVLVCTGTKIAGQNSGKFGCSLVWLSGGTDCDSLVIARNFRMSTEKLIDLHVFDPHGMKNLYGEKKTVFSVWALNHRPQTYISPSNIK